MLEEISFVQDTPLYSFRSPEMATVGYGVGKGVGVGVKVGVGVDVGVAVGPGGVGVGVKVGVAYWAYTAYGMINREAITKKENRTK